MGLLHNACIYVIIVFVLLDAMYSLYLWGNHLSLYFFILPIRLSFNLTNPGSGILFSGRIFIPFIKILSSFNLINPTRPDYFGSSGILHNPNFLFIQSIQFIHELFILSSVYWILVLYWFRLCITNGYQAVVGTSPPATNLQITVNELLLKVFIL